MKEENRLPVSQDIDPLKGVYHESIVDHPGHLRNLAKRDSALLVIDMQFLDAARGHGVFAEDAVNDLSPESQDFYFNSLEKTVIPNIRRLQNGFRNNGLEVIHTRIQSLTQDGRDRGAGHKRLHLHAPPGSKEAEFLPEVAPIGDEIVINKTSSGVFSTTNLYYVLKNLGIDALFVVGVYTNECVDTTVRAACDLGFLVTVVDDACTTVTPALHDATLATLRDRYARVISTQQALEEIDRCVPKPAEPRMAVADPI